MLGSIKALIVVLAIAVTFFHLARPIALQFMSVEDFLRRRFVWFVLTTAFFMCPNFWLYALVAVPMLVWASRRESNPIALYMLLLHVIPPIPVIIPLIGNNGLFPLDNYRLLAFFILIPARSHYRNNMKEGDVGRWGIMDILLLAYGALVVALYTPPDMPHYFVIPDSPTNMLRRAVLFFVDTYLLYFTVSRTCRSRPRIVEAAASFCLACGVMAALAIFENLRNWLLYTDIASRWANDAHAGFYLVRGGSVRAQTSAGHSIPQGYLFAIAFGFWLSLRSQVQNVKHRIGVTLLLLTGLYATLSRGAWLGAAAVYFTFLAAGQRAVSRLAKGAVLAVSMAGLILVSPIGDRVTEMLPQSGKPADDYRHRLAERGWEVVMAHPLFGDQFPYPELEDLRQGEGIIDIVNTYVGVGLNYGLIGLFLFLSFILLGMARAFTRSRALAPSDPDLAKFGTSLVACIAGTLVMIDSDSFNLGPQKMFYILAGLTTAYANLTVVIPPRLFATSIAGVVTEGDLAPELRDETADRP